MKKAIIAILVLSVLLCSCGNKADDTKADDTKASDTETGGAFTTSTDDIIARFEEASGDSPDDADRFLVPYEIDKPFKSVSFWLETYDHGELIEKFDVFGGKVDNQFNSNKGFVAMYSLAYEDERQELKFVNHLYSDEDTTTVTSADDMALDYIWRRRELEEVVAGYEPEGSTDINSDAPRIISYIGYYESGEFEEVSVDLTGESEGKSPGEMIQTPYLLVLRCEFEFEKEEQK